MSMAVGHTRPAPLAARSPAIEARHLRRCSFFASSVRPPNRHRRLPESAPSGARSHKAWAGRAQLSDLLAIFFETEEVRLPAFPANFRIDRPANPGIRAADQSHRGRASRADRRNDVSQSRGHSGRRLYHGNCGCRCRRARRIQIRASVCRLARAPAATGTPPAERTGLSGITKKGNKYICNLLVLPSRNDALCANQGDSAGNLDHEVNGVQACPACHDCPGQQDRQDCFDHLGERWRVLADRNPGGWPPFPPGVH